MVVVTFTIVSMLLRICRVMYREQTCELDDPYRLAMHYELAHLTTTTNIRELSHNLTIKH